MSQRGMATLVIVGIVVAVVVVAGVAVAAAIVLSGGGIGGGGAGGGGGINIAQATSLQFDVEARDASGNMVTSGTCYMKNIGQSNAKIRMDMTAQGTQVKIIIDAASQKFWLWSGETGWMDMSGYMNPDVYESMAQGYRSSLSNWGGTGEYTYTSSEGHSVRIYNIHVNPALSDSLFTPS